MTGGGLRASSTSSVVKPSPIGELEDVLVGEEDAVGVGGKNAWMEALVDFGAGATIVSTATPNVYGVYPL